MIKINLKHKKACPAKLKRSGGFTLLEALVAISILMVAIAAPITIAQKGLSSAVYSKNQMIASYLAQDAIEYVINQRDKASINNNFNWENLWNADWTGNLSTCLVSEDSPNGCQIDTIKNSIKITPNPPDFLQEDNNKFYGYATGGTPTDFTRQIKIIKPYNENEDEALVSVIVKWGTDSVTVNTLLFNY